MIGSGIFIVDCDIARLTDSPALYLAAWVVTAVMTMICALSYGELAAMMPKAGGQYVYLRESLGPLWGFLYGWTLFLVIETGTIAAVCVAFGKFLGVFFPAVSSTHWLWHIAHVPAILVGPMVLGNMEIGVSTANLAGIAVVLFLAAVNIFGVRLRRSRAERLHRGQGALACGAGSSGIHRGPQRRGHRGQLRQPLEPVLAQRRLALAASRAGGRAGADGDGEPVRDSGGGAGGLAFFRRRLEQRHIHRGRDQESAAQRSAFARAGRGIRADRRISSPARRTSWCCRCTAIRTALRCSRAACSTPPRTDWSCGAAADLSRMSAAT